MCFFPYRFELRWDNQRRVNPSMDKECRPKHAPWGTVVREYCYSPVSRSYVNSKARTGDGCDSAVRGKRDRDANRRNNWVPLRIYHGKRAINRLGCCVLKSKLREEASEGCPVRVV